jgi:hypothetical protein
MKERGNGLNIHPIQWQNMIKKNKKAKEGDNENIR